MLRYDELPAALTPDQLMDLAAALRELTGDLNHIHDLPAFLATTLAIDAVAVGLVERTGSGDARVTHFAAAGATVSPELENTLLEHAVQHLRPASPAPASPGHPLVKIINAEFYLVILALPADAQPLPHPTTELLNLFANFAARQLHATLGWRAYPPTIGEPFDRLTEREWGVLCGLNSEEGEKQLADHLGLSPHTLHSHIKSIYRKIGVQGRLPLLQRLDTAIRHYRLKTLARPAAADRAAG